MTRDLPETPSRPGHRRPQAPAAPVALAAILLLFCFAAIMAPAARAQEPGVRRDDGLVYFNLQNVDIRSALESISEVLGISYVLGGSVPTGTPITISTAAGIPIEKVPDLLDSVLRTYNLALIKTGDVFTVIQAGEAAQGVPGAEAARTQVYVYYLRNANAVDLANVLNQLFQGGVPAGGFTRRSEGRAALSEALQGQQLPYETIREDEVPQQQLPPQQPGQVTRIIPGELVGQTSIVPDETTNSLIIRTAPENYASIEETIAKLDKRPLQVLIEVTIAEITLDKSTQFGFEYFLRDKAEIGGETVRGELDLTTTTPFTGGLRARVFDSGNVDATFRALAADSRVNVLSTPRILAINNHEARILIGSEVPFVQFSRATTGDAIDQVVQYRNVGLELTVTPRINPDRYISMDLLQQVSALSPDVLFDAPIITTREAQTSLVVGDQQTIVLGGLMEDRKEKRKNGIPLLKDIPVLGLLFSSRTTRNVKTELVITLTPYIVGSDVELQSLRKEIESNAPLYEHELDKRRDEGEFVPGALEPQREAAPPAAVPGGPPIGVEPIPPAPADTAYTPPADTTHTPPADTAYTPPADTTSGPRADTTAAAPADTPSAAPAEGQPGPSSRVAPATEGAADAARPTGRPEEPDALPRVAPPAEAPAAEPRAIQEAPAAGDLKVSVSGADLLPSDVPPEPSGAPARLEGPSSVPESEPDGVEPEEPPAPSRSTSLERALLGATSTPRKPRSQVDTTARSRRDAAPADATPADPAPADATPTAARPSELASAAPAEAAPAEAAPAEAAPAETAPTDAAPADTRPSNARPPDGVAASELAIATPAGPRSINAASKDAGPGDASTSDGAAEVAPAEARAAEIAPAKAGAAEVAPAEARAAGIAPAEAEGAELALEEAGAAGSASVPGPTIPAPSGRTEAATPLVQSGTEETAEHALARAGAEPGELLETGSSGNADVPTRGVTEPTGFESTTGAEVGRADAGRETDGPGRLVAPEPETIEAPAGGTAEGGPGEPRPGIRPEPGSTEEEGYRVQAVAVPDPIVADFEAAHLRRLLGAEIPVYVDFVTPFYKVRVGDFATRSEASETLARVRELGYVDAWAVPSGIRAPSP